MRTGTCAALLAAVLALPAAPRGQRAIVPAGGDLVELDVLVLDRDGVPVGDLGVKDFEVKDDGRVVDIKTFAAVSGRHEDERPDSHVVLLLDDSSVPMTGTAVVQAMAQVILSRQQPGDEVTVVRLNNDRDEAFGDVETALARISQYHAGVVPYQNLGTSERALKVIASVSRTLESVEHRRKLIVCIGGPRVCNVLEPQPRGYSVIWRPWVEAVTAAARANVAVYAAMPVPIGTPMMLNGGLVYATGGSAFANAMKFDRFVDALWREATDYYLLGYWPSGGKRDLRSIDVKVARKGLRVRARHAR
jgi:VWFA-related protein